MCTQWICMFNFKVWCAPCISTLGWNLELVIIIHILLGASVVFFLLVAMFLFVKTIKIAITAAMTQVINMPSAMLSPVTTAESA